MKYIYGCGDQEIILLWPVGHYSFFASLIYEITTHMPTRTRALEGGSKHCPQLSWSSKSTAHTEEADPEEDGLDSNPRRPPAF